MAPVSVSPEPSAGSSAGIGDLLRYWRGVRRKSQLELALDAASTPRYVSFVETGRAQPSRSMVLRLARALDVPMRERNELLLAAGYAPAYAVDPLDSPALARVERALGSMLDQHEPFPAVVMDRSWNVLRANRGAGRLFGRLLAPDPVPDDANVLRLMLEPGPVRAGVVNWPAVAGTLLERARREAVGGVLSPDTAAFVRRLRSRPEIAALEPEAPPAGGPVLDVTFAVDGRELSFFSVVCTIGTPADVTAQELRLEAFFPSDATTRDTWGQIAP
jgi:transcriptional regulator with XRE-family HTH domain